MPDIGLNNYLKQRLKLIDYHLDVACYRQSFFVLFCIYLTGFISRYRSLSFVIWLTAHKLLPFLKQFHHLFVGRNRPVGVNKTLYRSFLFLSFLLLIDLKIGKYIDRYLSVCMSVCVSVR